MRFIECQSYSLYLNCPGQMVPGLVRLQNTVTEQAASCPGCAASREIKGAAGGFSPRRRRWFAAAFRGLTVGCRHVWRWLDGIQMDNPRNGSFLIVVEETATLY